MKYFIVLRTFTLSVQYQKDYIQGKIYKENELITGWRVKCDELSFLQRMNYIEIIQDMHNLVKVVLLNKKVE
jgi:hypothetical protein